MSVTRNVFAEFSSDPIHARFEVINLGDVIAEHRLHIATSSDEAEAYQIISELIAATNEFMGYLTSNNQQKLLVTPLLYEQVYGALEKFGQPLCQVFKKQAGYKKDSDMYLLLGNAANYAATAVVKCANVLGNNPADKKSVELKAAIFKRMSEIKMPRA